MPTLPLPRCKIPSCSNLSVERGKPYCLEHLREGYKVNQLFNSDPFYSSPAWRAVRDRYGSLHPNCEECLKDDVIVPKRVVDHIIPRSLGGDDYAESNLQSLCESHHNKKRVQEREALKKARHLSGH